MSSESIISDTEAVLMHTHFVVKEQLALGHTLPENFHDDLTTLLMKSYPALGYEMTRNLITATERYLRKNPLMEEHSHVIFQKFQDFVNTRNNK